MKTANSDVYTLLNTDNLTTDDDVPPPSITLRHHPHSSVTYFPGSDARQCQESYWLRFRVLTATMMMDGCLMGRYTVTDVSEHLTACIMSLDGTSHKTAIFRKLSFRANQQNVLSFILYHCGWAHKVTLVSRLLLIYCTSPSDF